MCCQCGLLLGQRQRRAEGREYLGGLGPGLLATALEAGFDEHLVKPVDPDELRRELGKAAECAPPGAHS